MLRMIGANVFLCLKLENSERFKDPFCFFLLKKLCSVKPRSVLVSSFLN